MTSQKLICQGAEAKILLDEKNKIIIKDRISKSYRIPELDIKIIKSRTKKEANILEKARKLISSPNPKVIDGNKIEMPFIKGKKLSETLEKLDYKKVCKKIAENISILHDNNIIHGDLTTSNIILDEKGKAIFIDFGLGFISNKFEDKAVDLHLIKQALEAKHFSIWKECWKIIEENYKPRDRVKILEQLKKVELRGRYKH